MQNIGQMQADDRGLTDVLTVAFPSATAFEAERACAAGRFAELIDRAKAIGLDFMHQDMVMVLMANAGVLAATADAAQHTGGAWWPI